jgi:hypothetical protein
MDILLFILSFIVSPICGFLYLKQLEKKFKNNCYHKNRILKQVNIPTSELVITVITLFFMILSVGSIINNETISALVVLGGTGTLILLLFPIMYIYKNYFLEKDKLLYIDYKRYCNTFNGYLDEIDLKNKDLYSNFNYIEFKQFLNNYQCKNCYKRQEALKVIEFIGRKPDGLTLWMSADIFYAIKYCLKNIISSQLSIKLISLIYIYNLL